MFYEIDIVGLKASVLKELVNKTYENSFSIYGAPEKHSLENMLKKFDGIEIIEDSGTEEALLNCVTRFLDSSLDRIFIQQWTETSTGDTVGIPSEGGGVGGVGESGCCYQGSIANAGEMTSVSGGAHTDGEWWEIIGDFEHNGTNYFTGEEVYWVDGVFKKQADYNAFATVIVSPGNISKEEDGNGRIIMDGGSFKFQRRVSGVWKTLQTIS